MGYQSQQDEEENHTTEKSSMGSQSPRWSPHWAGGLGQAGTRFPRLSGMRVTSTQGSG